MTVTDPLYLAAGVVFVAIGVALLAARREHAPAVALAMYVTGLGALYVTYGLWGGPGVVPPALPWALGLVAAVGLGAFALLFPAPLEKGARRDAVFAVAYGAAFIISLTWLAYRGDPSSLSRYGDAPGVGAVLVAVSFALVAIVSVATTLLLPLRARRLGPGEGNAMRAIGMIAVALLLVSPGGPFPGIIAAARGEAPLASGVIVIATGLVSSSLWVWATTGHHARAARNIFLTLVALNLGLGLTHQVAGELVVQIGRLLSALVLAYAVVAGQIDGLDVKVRFAISKSTVAAAFIAVFFVASEAAQQFLGETLGGQYVGIAAAGALVFAMAPLQRAAERLAERAVPTGPAPARDTGSGPSVAESAYQAAVRLALRGGVTRAEEFELARIAEAHGLSHVRALELRGEIEDAWREEARP